MSIAVVGAGALGGFMGFKLRKAGFPVVFVDRGERLHALAETGLTLVNPDGVKESIPQIKATSDFREAGPCDLVILAVKAHQIEGLCHLVPELFHQETMVMTVQNGLPWWYFQKHPGDYEGTNLQTLDPQGRINSHIDAERIIGCVAYPAARVIRPGVVQHVEGDRFPLGELDGRDSQRCRALEQVLSRSGFRSRVISDIRSEIWLKAWGALSFNPISALTRATMEDICRFPETRELARRMMVEAQAVAEKLGVSFRHTIERRLDGAQKVGAHKTSMLQDVESGQTLELEALVGSVVELADLTGTSVPIIEAIYACTKLLDLTE